MVMMWIGGASSERNHCISSGGIAIEVLLRDILTVASTSLPHQHHKEKGKRVAGRAAKKIMGVSRAPSGLSLWQCLMTLALALHVSVKGVAAKDGLSSEEIVFTIIAFVVGAVICFFGYRLFKIMVFLSGFVPAGGCTFILLNSHTSLHVWVQIAIACGVGLCAGLLLLFLQVVAIFLLGACGGFVLGIYVQSFVGGGLIDNEIGKWCFIAGLAAVGGIIALLLAKFVIILVTSFGGAFAVVIAVDTWAGGELSTAFRNVFQEQTQNSKSNDDHDLNHLSTMSKVFLGGAALLAVTGVFVQLFVTARKYHHDPKKRDKAMEEERRGLINGQPSSFSAYNNAPAATVVSPYAAPTYSTMSGTNIPRTGVSRNVVLKKI